MASMIYGWGGDAETLMEFDGVNFLALWATRTAAEMVILAIFHNAVIDTRLREGCASCQDGCTLICPWVFAILSNTYRLLQKRIAQLKTLLLLLLLLLECRNE